MKKLFNLTCNIIGCSFFVIVSPFLVLFAIGAALRDGDINLLEENLIDEMLE